MQLFRSTLPELLRPSVATIGFFDGVHKGHQYLIKQVREAAAIRNFTSAVITFPDHPSKVVRSNYCPQLLTSSEEKTALLTETGLDYCFMLDFTPEIAALSARKFMAFLQKQYNIQALVVGYDHRFGCNRHEGITDYLRYGKELGIEIILAQAYHDKEVAISSSMIRRLLAEGNVSKAAIYLGYTYFLEGIVVDGYRIGRKIGFPTANLRINDPEKLVPADGVYAVWVTVADKKYAGMLSIGCRPTFHKEGERSIEVHILGFQSDIYDHSIRLSLAHYIRPEAKFDSVEKLIAQLHKDAETVSHLFKLN